MELLNRHFFLQVKLTEHSKTPEDFLRKYEELKSKNARNLDPLVYLLSKLTEDKEVWLKADVIRQILLSSTAM